MKLYSLQKLNAGNLNSTSRHTFLLWQLIFFESTEAVIIEAIINIIATMMTFNPRFLQLRDKPSSLLFMKEDTIKVIFVLLCWIKFLCQNFNFLKALIEWRYVQISVGYLPTPQKPSQLLQHFVIFTKLNGLPDECFYSIGNT